MSRFLSAVGLYALTLPRRAAQGLAPSPSGLPSSKDPWSGLSEEADAMFRGEYHLAGEIHRFPNETPWGNAATSDRASNQPGANWQQELHSFGWLRHFAAAAEASIKRGGGGEAAQRHVRALVQSWLARFGHWDPASWQTDITARRLIAWFSHWGLLSTVAGDALQQALMLSITRQARHLYRNAASCRGDIPRLTAAAGLIFAGYCLNYGRRNIAGRMARRGEAMLTQELAIQFPADAGAAENRGHVSRNPSALFEALRLLISVQSLFGDIESPPDELCGTLDATIARLIPVLSAMRHGDGGLALFNGGFEEDKAAVDEIIAHSKSDEDCNIAGADGYQRLAAGNAVVIMDAAAPTPEAHSSEAHAGCLSFEMSSGQHRLIVNCGTHISASASNAGHKVSQDESWLKASRSSAAHSMLVVADTNSWPNAQHGRAVSVMRRDEKGEVWLVADQNSYEAAFGVIQRRRLYLNPAGDDLRGEDSLIPAKATDGTPNENKPDDTEPDSQHCNLNNNLAFTLRFHLHPAVQASLLQNRQAVLLRLPDGSGWQFRTGGDAEDSDGGTGGGTSGSSLALEESVYLGRRGHMRRCEQIVLTGLAVGRAATVKWAFRKIENDPA